MDCQAEQEMELEALEAILMEDFETEVSDPPPTGWPDKCQFYRVAIKIDEEMEKAESSTEKKLSLLFSFTPQYPEEAPRVKLSSLQGMSAMDADEVNNILSEQIEANIGMPMIYTLVTALKEWLIDQVAGAIETSFELDPKELQRRKDEAEEQRLAAIRAHGIPVTAETFAAWKQSFEMEKRTEQIQLHPDSNKNQGPSGKAFFIANEVDSAQAGKEGEDEEISEEDEEGYDEEGYDEEGDESHEEDDDLGDDTEDESDDDVELIDRMLAQKSQGS